MIKPNKNSKFLTAGNRFVNVVSVGKQNQRDKKHKACHLRVFHKLVARLAARHDFVKQEHYVASVKGRDWKQVHHAEHNRQQSSYAPEHFPTPMLRENVIDSLESSNTFISTCRRRKYRFQLTAISRKFFLAARDSNAKRLEKSVFLASDSIKSEALQVVC